MEERKIIAYKGFNGDMTCRDFQYEVGKEYIHEGDIEPCGSGFHACRNPFDVLDYYDNMLNNRYCIVEQSGTIKERHDKQVSSKISIKEEIGWQGLFKAGIEYIKDLPKPVGRSNDIRDNGGYNAHIGSSGDYAKIGSSGDDAKIGSSGCDAQIGSSGDYAKIGSSGCDAHIGSSGCDAQIGSSGDYAKIGSSGDDAQIGSSGYSAHIGSSGDDAQISSSGGYAKIGSNGYSAHIDSSGYFVHIGSSDDYAKIGSSGVCARIGSSGGSARIGSSGDSAHIGSSGDFAQIGSSGLDSVIMCAGNWSTVCAKKGSWITLSEWEDDKEKGRLFPKCVKTEYVDGERIKEDVWYKLVDGEFKEVKK